MIPSGSISARYVNVRIQVNLPGDTPILSGLEIFFDGSPVFEEINDFDTATLTGANRIGVGDVRLPLEENYTKVRQVQLALQNTGAGWTWEVIDKDSILGPRIRIYDNTNTPADAVIDASIRGV